MPPIDVPIPAPGDLPVHAVAAELHPASSTCQRWNDRQHTWVRRRDGGFDPGRYTVAIIDESAARAFTAQHHYLGNAWPATSKRMGLMLHAGGEPELVGVAAFGIPASAKVLTNVFPDLEPYRQSLELSRFVLVGDTITRGPHTGQLKAPSNSESWFLARCLSLLAEQDVRGIVAFSDPVPRLAPAAGGRGQRLVFGGHRGLIYQASGALALGRGTARLLTVLGDGTTISDRALQKARTGESGAGYVEQRLVLLGARPRQPRQDRRRWLADALDAVGARRIRHAGNYRYALLTSRSHRRSVRILGERTLYPKQLDPAA